MVKDVLILSPSRIFKTLVVSEISLPQERIHSLSGLEEHRPPAWRVSLFTVTRGSIGKVISGSKTLVACSSLVSSCPGGHSCGLVQGTVWNGVSVAQ